MKQFKSTLFILFFASLFSAVFGQKNYVPNQLIIQLHYSFTKRSAEEKLAQAFPGYGVYFDRELSKTCKIFTLNFDTLAISAEELLDKLKNREEIELVQFNHTNIQQRTTIPNDLEYPIQWSLGSGASARIFAPEAWDLTTDGLSAEGDTIVMAVVDGGVDINHIDLNLFKNHHEIPNNGIDDDQNGYVDDYDGWNAYNNSGNVFPDDHGTHVAGIMGAKTNNSTGVAGIVWGGKILPVSASSGQESVVIEGYGYILEMRKKYNESNGDSGAFVVCSNSSFGVDYGNPVNYPIWCAFYDSLGAQGIINMAATSNANLNVDVVGDIPTTCPSNYMVAVSNINSSGALLGGYGATQIDLAAPGTQIRSTIPNQNYGYKTGTSMATPHVAGVAGALYSAMCSEDISFVRNHPDSAALWVRDALLETVTQHPLYNQKNVTSGRLNFFEAVEYIQHYSHCMTVTPTITPDYCNNCNGVAAFSANGPYAPYSFQFSDSLNKIDPSTFGGLCQGSYLVTITDGSGYTVVDTIDVASGDSLQSTTQVVVADNNSTANGGINLTVNGGTPNYTYVWSNGSTNQNLENVLPGTYTVTITDQNGCVTFDTATIWTVGMNNPMPSTYNIYPNPSEGIINITVPKEVSSFNLRVVNTVGVEMIRQKNVPVIGGSNQINLDLPNGVYFIQINDFRPQMIMVQ